MKAPSKIHSRWVIKAGSRMVCEGGLPLLRHWMLQVARLRDEHFIETIWVTSGAIAWARSKTQSIAGQKVSSRAVAPRSTANPISQHRARLSLAAKQAMSAVGQPLVMDLYAKALRSTGLLSAQVLLSADDIERTTSRRNLQQSLKQLLSWGVLPILNENDAVSTQEIQFGDNDTLSAHVARTLRADRLVILTDVDGLYDRNPRRFKNAKLVPYCARVGARELALVDRKVMAGPGTGGMYSKILAAKLAARSGIVTHLVRGDTRFGLLRLAQGQQLGTQIGGHYRGSSS